MDRVAVALNPNDPHDRLCPTDAWVRRAARNDAGLSVATDRERLMKALPNADIFVGTHLSERELEAARQLSWIHVPAAGVDEIPLDAVRARGIRLTNSRGVMAREVAEHALALVLTLSRSIDLAVVAQQRRAWLDVRAARAPLTLNGLTMGIVGYGAIGTSLARLATALGMRILGVRRRAGVDDHGLADTVHGLDRLDEVLRASDVVVLALPLTADTHHIVGARELRAMKASALLVNVARGGVWDEEAVERALRHGQIAGAASDVFAQEPLPEAHALWDAPNFVVTPHLAGHSQRLWGNLVDLFFTNLASWRRGEPMENVVAP